MIPTFSTLFNKTAVNSKWQRLREISAVLIIIPALFSCQASSKKTAGGTLKDTTGIIELPKPAPLAKAEAERLRIGCEQWFDSALLYKGYNGSMLVAKNGNIVFEKYTGTGHLPGNDLLTASTPLQIASTSKTFTAMAVLKLWQEGKLNIDDELSKYIKIFNYPGVTIRSLLNHRSGLPNYLYFMEKLGWDKKKIASNEDVLNYMVTKKAELENITSPNTHFTYCNTNYALLALLVENVTGEKFPAYLQQHFFGPLQMKNTFVYLPSDSVKVNYSYDWRGGLIPFNSSDGVYGDKNVYTTPEDLLIWDRALSSKKIFTEETLAQAYAPYSNEKPGVRNYGLGWRMNIYADGKKMIYHNGWWHGSRAVFIRLLKEDATIILISNKDFRSIYHAKILSNLFGDYYTGEEDEESDAAKTTDNSSTAKPAAVKAPAPELSKKNGKMQKLFKDKNKVNKH
ncbi:serine hydrolase domain-containing protein [Ferruginibacter sp. SUN106]|uniref:serine hydrolase domain-containing protein n=1 Tax=Ferruginibacter sp. SUN106 TaxID=2978348 RepID=UPI003D370044